MAGSIQFRTSEAVLTAYENRKVAAWSLWQNKQFLFKYEGNTVEEGREALEEWLDLLSQGSNAIYTIKVYEDIPGKIKENTPCDGSFNFRLNEDSQLATRSGAMIKMESEINALKAALAAKEEEDDEEEDETTEALGKIGDLINHPVVMQLANLLFGVKPPATALPGALGNVSATEQEQKIIAAVDILKMHDTRLGDHLEKLAQIAATKNENFKYLLNVLDSM